MTSERVKAWECLSVFGLIQEKLNHPLVSLEVRVGLQVVQIHP
jgi:hypothetical protein